MSRPRMGQRVRFSAILERDKTYGGPVVWKRKPATGEGVYVGARTVYEGDHVRAGGSHYDYEPGYIRAPRGVFHALVAVHERSNPARVPFDSLEVADG